MSLRGIIFQSNLTWTRQPQPAANAAFAAVANAAAAVAAPAAASSSLALSQAAASAALAAAQAAAHSPNRKHAAAAAAAAEDDSEFPVDAPAPAAAGAGAGAPSVHSAQGVYVLKSAAAFSPLQPASPAAAAASAASPANLQNFGFRAVKHYAPAAQLQRTISAPLTVRAGVSQAVGANPAAVAGLQMRTAIEAANAVAAVASAAVAPRSRHMAPPSLGPNGTFAVPYLKTKLTKAVTQEAPEEPFSLENYKKRMILEAVEAGRTYYCSTGYIHPNDFTRNKWKFEECVAHAAAAIAFQEEEIRPMQAEARTAAAAAAASTQPQPVTANLTQVAKERLIAQLQVDEKAIFPKPLASLIADYVIPDNRQQYLLNLITDAMKGVVAHHNMENILITLVGCPAKMLKDFAFFIVNFSGTDLRFLPAQLRDDEEIGLAAVEQNGSAYASLSDRLKDNQKIIWAACQRTPGVVNLLSAKWKANGDLALLVIERNGIFLSCFDPKFLKDRKYVIMAAKNYGMILQFAPDFQDDDEVVAIAINSHPMAYQYASDRLKNDKDKALAAVRGNQNVVHHLPEQLQKDPDIIDEISRPLKKQKRTADSDVSSQS